MWIVRYGNGAASIAMRSPFTHYSFALCVSLVRLSTECGIGPPMDVWCGFAIHSSATQLALYLLKAICITITLNYECLLRESRSLLQKRELLSAILFSRIAVVHKPVAERFSNKLLKNKHYLSQHYLNIICAAHSISVSNSEHSNHFLFRIIPLHAYTIRT